MCENFLFNTGIYVFRESSCHILIDTISYSQRYSRPPRWSIDTIPEQGGKAPSLRHKVLFWTRQNATKQNLKMRRSGAIIYLSRKNSSRTTNMYINIKNWQTCISTSQSNTNSDVNYLFKTNSNENKNSTI